MQTMITYWPRGCATEEGLSAMVVDGFLDREEAQRELMRRGKPIAVVWGVQPIGIRPVAPQFDREYVNEMARGTRQRVRTL